MHASGEPRHPRLRVLLEFCSVFACAAQSVSQSVSPSVRQSVSQSVAGRGVICSGGGGGGGEGGEPADEAPVSEELDRRRDGRESHRAFGDGGAQLLEHVPVEIRQWRAAA